jgi:4-phospho-D-threonate 3-dehydrogenase / 4-phospho-D-erythronate 3-dehydrogenase
MGDPAGIGPEIVLKSVADKALLRKCVPIIIGDALFLAETAEQMKLPFELTVVRKGEELNFPAGKPIIYDLGNIKTGIRTGVETKAAGKAAAQYIETATKLALAEKLDAIATAPINKKSLSLAAVPFPGHTEMLAYLTDTEEFAMAFFGGRLCVVLLSIHVPLKQAIAFVKKKRLVDLIRLTERELKRLKNKEVKLAMAGLNPHASEGGLFGSEETREIVPALNECREKYGINVQGPFSPDTIFIRAAKGEFDAVISCYHDQATIAVKCLAFGEAVNVTLGLPIIRTSVDHGTAFEIAGKGVADASSMKAAISLAADFSVSRIKG